jgi:hypothetical protein
MLMKKNEESTPDTKPSIDTEKVMETGNGYEEKLPTDSTLYKKKNGTNC